MSTLRVAGVLLTSALFIANVFAGDYTERQDLRAVEFDPYTVRELRTPLSEITGGYRFITLPVEGPEWEVTLSPEERRFAVFLEIYRFFDRYIQELRRNNDRVFANRDDFREVYIHEFSKQLKDVSFQFEAFRTTVYNQAVSSTTTGGGAGLRVDMQVAHDGKLGISFLPFYGEQRSFSAPVAGTQVGATDFVIRSSIGAGYSHKINDNIEPGVQVFYQPQVISFAQFRIYAEAFIRLKVITSVSQKLNPLAIQEVVLVPKLIFWKSTDRSGAFGDPISETFGETYRALNQNIYGLLNLEFHFRM